MSLWVCAVTIHALLPTTARALLRLMHQAARTCADLTLLWRWRCMSRQADNSHSFWSAMLHVWEFEAHWKLVIKLRCGTAAGSDGLRGDTPAAPAPATCAMLRASG